MNNKFKNYNDLFTTIENANKILIVTPDKQDADSLGSAVSLSSLLNKINKSNQILANDATSSQLGFISSNTDISYNIENLRSFVIRFNNEKLEIENIKVIKDKNDNKTKIVIVPKTGFISHNNIDYPKGELLFDTIIYVDGANLELFKYFTSKVELMPNTNIIVLDHHISNTEYGNINIIDIEVSSTCELIYNIFFKKKYKESIDPYISTALMSGIISDTNSFKNENTYISTFTTVAELIKYGADKKAIIQHLYQSRSVESMHLWGKIMNRIQYNSKTKVAHLNIYPQDFTETNTTYKDIDNIIDEVVKTIKGTDIAILIYPKEDHTYVSLRSTNDNIDVSEFATINGGGGHAKAAGFSINGQNIEASSIKVIKELYIYLGYDQKNNTDILENKTPYIETQKRIEIDQNTEKYVQKLRQGPEEKSKEEYKYQKPISIKPESRSQELQYKSPINAPKYQHSQKYISNEGKSTDSPREFQKPYQQQEKRSDEQKPMYKPKEFQKSPSISERNPVDKPEGIPKHTQYKPMPHKQNIENIQQPKRNIPIRPQDIDDKNKYIDEQMYPQTNKQYQPKTEQNNAHRYEKPQSPNQILEEKEILQINKIKDEKISTTPPPPPHPVSDINDTEIKYNIPSPF